MPFHGCLTIWMPIGFNAQDEEKLSFIPAVFIELMLFIIIFERFRKPRAIELAWIAEARKRLPQENVFVSRGQSSLLGLPRRENVCRKANIFDKPKQSAFLKLRNDRVHLNEPVKPKQMSPSGLRKARDGRIGFSYFDMTGVMNLGVDYVRRKMIHESENLLKAENIRALS